tara:strand:+ start:162 stop:479 length:318 start_codon:yes stop_codon:yes gene_type:complete
MSRETLDHEFSNPSSSEPSSRQPHSSTTYSQFSHQPDKEIFKQPLIDSFLFGTSRTVAEKTKSDNCFRIKAQINECLKDPEKTNIEHFEYLWKSFQNCHNIGKIN